MMMNSEPIERMTDDDDDSHRTVAVLLGTNVNQVYDVIMKQQGVSLSLPLTHSFILYSSTFSSNMQMTLP